VTSVTVWHQKPSDFYDFWCMKSWGNLTAEDYKFAHLTCILWPHYLKKCKKSHFQQCYLFIEFNVCAPKCLGYYWIKWITTVTMQLSGRLLIIEIVEVTSLCADTTMDGVCYVATVRSPTMLCWNSVHVSTSRCHNSTTIHIPGYYTLMHHAHDAIIHNLGQDCRMATC